MHPHLLFDLLAYGIGFRLWLVRWRRSRSRDPLGLAQGLWIVVCAILAAAAGAKLLAWGEDWAVYRDVILKPEGWIGGRTIVGGLLGGWIGVELGKRRAAIRERTGDVYVVPLLVGICLGRIGCFLSGLPDQTHGVATTAAWGVDFGDGIPRHPTQLYEILVLLLFGAVLWSLRRRALPAGHRFRTFIGGYLTWRLLVEFIKPVHAPYLGLSMIQLASLAGALFCVYSLLRDRRTTLPESKGPLNVG